MSKTVNWTWLLYVALCEICMSRPHRLSMSSFNEGHVNKCILRRGIWSMIAIGFTELFKTINLGTSAENSISSSRSLSVRLSPFIFFRSAELKPAFCSYIFSSFYSFHWVVSASINLFSLMSYHSFGLWLLAKSLHDNAPPISLICIYKERFQVWSC